jgi:hypothetical protein
MKYRPSFYGQEAAILGMAYEQHARYQAILKKFAEEFGGEIPNKYKGLAEEHAKDASEL